MTQAIIRTAAHAAYAAAVADPAGTDWRELAETLFSALPALPKAARESGLPTWWAEYDLPRAYISDSLDVLFADGEMIRVGIHRAPRGLPRIPAACRAAIGFYRERNGWDHAVPAFASLTVADTGATFDPEACSSLTAALRAIPGTVTARAVTAKGIARMEAELARREAGLAHAVKRWDNRPSLIDDVMDHPDLAMRDAWQAAVDGAAAELADMRAAYRAQRGESVPVTIADPAEFDPCAFWCEAVAPLYADPCEAEIAGTFGAGEGVATADPLGDGRMLISAATIVSPDLNVVPREAIATPAPVVGIAASDPPATACDPEPDLTTTHTVIAVCLSARARDALFARILDGTFPHRPPLAKGGSWHVTLADALDCQDIPSVRWVGMPRKAYTRRAAPLAEAA